MMLVGLSAGSGAEERAEARRPEAQHLGVKQFEMPEGVAMISICQRPCTVMYSQHMTHRGREAGVGPPTGRDSSWQLQSIPLWDVHAQHSSKGRRHRRQ